MSEPPGAAADPDDNPFRAGRDGTEHELRHAVGVGGKRCVAIRRRHQREAARLRRLDHRDLVTYREPRPNRIAERAADREAVRRRACGHERVDGPLTAVGDRYAFDDSAWQDVEHAEPHRRSGLARGQRPLELVRRDDYAQPISHRLEPVRLVRCRRGGRGCAETTVQQGVDLVGGARILRPPVGDHRDHVARDLQERGQLGEQHVDVGERAPFLDRRQPVAGIEFLVLADDEFGTGRAQQRCHAGLDLALAQRHPHRGRQPTFVDLGGCERHLQGRLAGLNPCLARLREQLQYRQRSLGRSQLGLVFAHALVALILRNPCHAGQS